MAADKKALVGAAEKEQTMTSTERRLQFEARMRAKFAAKRPPGDDFEQQPSREHIATAADHSHDRGANDERIPCERCGNLHDWQYL